MQRTAPCEQRQLQLAQPVLGLQGGTCSSRRPHPRSTLPGLEHSLQGSAHCQLPESVCACECVSVHVHACVGLWILSRLGEGGELGI